MPTNRNDRYLARGHPVSAVIESATLGQLMSKGQMDELILNRPDLPDGHSLDRFRVRVGAAAAAVAKACSPDGASVMHQRAQQLADQLIAEIAVDMTDPERALTETHADPESSTEIAARMFER